MKHVTRTMVGLAMMGVVGAFLFGIAAATYIVGSIMIGISEHYNISIWIEICILFIIVLILTIAYMIGKKVEE